METVTVDGSGGTDRFYEPTLCGASAVYEYYIGQRLTPLTRIYKYRQPLKETMYCREREKDRKKKEREKKEEGRCWWGFSGKS